MARTKVDLRNARRMAQEMRRGGRYVSALRTEWAKSYELFLQKRYDAFSTGQGTWPPLNAKYLASKVRRGLSPLIMIATGAARAAFKIGGALTRTATDRGVQISLNARKREGRILTYHQGRRPTLVPPDGGTVGLMQRGAVGTFERVMAFAKRRR